MVARERKAEFKCQRGQTAGLFENERGGGRLFCSVLRGGSMRRYVNPYMTKIKLEKRGLQGDSDLMLKQIV